ncbi:unnamed protein product [Caenorhabditis bovis]|uniref:Cyclin-like domain-containing protein n=1 Tax=Caenorhabditis bovis TaxID=2654633 RepID=A0A8S1EGE0_9PELO|nr:unnamed protein product [Caenorhabditis bovis]
MASISSWGAGTQTDRPAPPKWTFSREEMQLSASQRDGMSAEEELCHRQQAASFIQEMVDALNQNMKDQRGRITQLGMCVANVHMHRFFYFHSFKRFDYKDVAAACIFLSGKSEESPRKLTHVVSVWQEKKMKKPFSSETHRIEACQFIVTLESCILQTIAFDLNVDLPHQHVIKIMESFDKNGYRKKITNCAYYFATDVLCVMDWALRYSCTSIAVAVVHLVAIFADFKMESLFPADPSKKWFSHFDEEMTEEKLIEMENDFMRVYQSCSHLHYASKIAAIAQNQKSISRATDDSSRVNNAYKDRRPQRSPRQQNFTTDYERKNEDNGRWRDDRPRHGISYLHKEEQQVEKSFSYDRELAKEDERRKRENEKISGNIPEKRQKIGPLSANFVSSTTPSDGKEKEWVKSQYKRPDKSFSPLTSKHESSSTLSPPPVPPAMASAVVDMDLEDGELK